MSKRHKTSTGALHPSAGFPGTNKVHNRVSPELLMEQRGVAGEIHRMHRIGNTVVVSISEFDATASRDANVVSGDF